MALELILRARARFDTVELSQFLLRHSAIAAERFLEACELTFRQLQAAPGIGGLYPTGVERYAGLRAFAIRGFPNHVAFYLIRESHIEILRVLHGARDVEAALQEV